MEGENCNNTPKPKSHNFKICFCKYCGRRFLNSQALGGHQNAHKKERRDAKHQKQETMMMASLAMPPLIPYSFVQPHGVVLQQQINGAQPAFPGTAFSNSHPLSCEYWPGSYRVDEGALYTYVSTQDIIKNQVQAEDGAEKQQVDDIYYDQQEVSELPDLNLDLSL